MAPVKGGYRSYRPKKVYFTSQYTPNEIFFTEPRDLDAILRRVKIENWTLDKRIPIEGLVEVDHRQANFALLASPDFVV